MQIAVIGAGAVGCYYGAKLLRAGHDVTLVGRQTHVDAINANGLRFESAEFDGFIPAKAVTPRACTTRSGIRSRSKWLIFSRNW